jgi:GNAT superfamily N-acetyltransferase
MTYRVHTVTPEDWRAFRAVRLEALLDSPDAFWQTHDVEAALDDVAWQHWVASRIAAGKQALFSVVADCPATGGDAWVGIVGAALDPRRPTVAHVFSMYVTPDHRGAAAGVGRLLIDVAISWARGTDAEILRLDANEVNKRALAFYRRLGWTETGKLTPFRDDPSTMLVEMAYGASGRSGRPRDSHR